MFLILSTKPVRLFLRQLLNFGNDRCIKVSPVEIREVAPTTLTWRIQALIGNLLVQTTASLLARPHVRILGGQSTFKQPSTILRTELKVIERQPATRQ